MKITLGLAAALVSVANAAQQSGKVYIRSLPSSDKIPSVSSDEARLIFQQRFDILSDRPSSAFASLRQDTEQAVGWLNQFGKAPAPMFSESAQSAKQLLVVVEDLSEQSLEKADELFGSRPSFIIPEIPSAKAIDGWLGRSINRGDISSRKDCGIDEALNTYSSGCWTGEYAFLRYNAQKGPESFDSIVNGLAGLAKAGMAGSPEISVVLLPASSVKTDGQPDWEAFDLHRRQEELPMSSIGESESKPSTSSRPASALVASDLAPGCFSSQQACEDATGNCSGHGECKSKHSRPEGSKNPECFVCHCLATRSESGSLTEWAGSTCQKKDISVPFWLFAGFTLVMVGILSLAIGMLYSVGEEKLPGVIGAGVSKSK